MEKISYKEAKAKGLKHYYTGKPCKRGHISLRLTCNETCEECHRDQTAVWKRNNASKIRRSKQKYNRANRDKNQEYDWNRRGYPTPTRPRPDVCDNCKQPETRRSSTGDITDLCNDHCHKTGKFRGWLCSRCNALAGKADEMIPILKSMSNYLDSFYKES